MVSAPAALASWRAAVATPEPTAWMRTAAPGRSPPMVNMASWAVMPASGRAPASVRLMPAGTRSSIRSWAMAYSACASPAAMAMTGSPTFQPVTPSPSAATSPASSRPGTSSRKPGGGG